MGVAVLAVYTTIWCLGVHWFTGKQSSLVSEPQKEERLQKLVLLTQTVVRVAILS